MIGRVILSKGAQPWTVPKLKERLAVIWKLSSLWRLISLGKGFYDILLTSIKDNASVWGCGSLNLKLGIPWARQWTRGFDPTSKKTTNAEVWVRFYRLSCKLWDLSILFSIVRRLECLCG